MRRSRGLLTWAVAATFAIACTSSTAPTTSAPAGPLKIGVLVPYTESALDSDIGASQKRAADLYLRLHGGKLGRRDVSLVFNDESALDPGINTVRLRQFLEQDHVELLLGGAGGPAAYLMRDVAEASKLVYVDTSAAANALTRTTSGCTPSCKSRYVFRTAPTSWQLSEPLGEWAAKNGPKEFYAVYADDDFGTESAAAFAEGLAKNGGKVTGTSAKAEKTGDWPKVVAAIKAQPTKNVFAAFFTEDAERFLAAWEAAGLRAAGYTLYGPGPLAGGQVLKVAKEAALGAVTSFPWAPDVAGAENAAFVDAFRKAYTDEDTGQPLAPDGYAALMWDAMAVLDRALAVTKGEAKNADALVAAMESVSLSAPGGPLSVDRVTHAAILDVYIREVRATGGAFANVTTAKIASVRDPGP
ncbi:MAG TPA: ABC transporter substrate-binding protein [Candidatus Limnocylindria bacterium]|nr:ABC transporter substrate-binding protein [Candidatus Limnocylindria bacterium]